MYTFLEKYRKESVDRNFLLQEVGVHLSPWTYHVVQLALVSFDDDVDSWQSNCCANSATSATNFEPLVQHNAILLLAKMYVQVSLKERRSDRECHPC
ncbi:hypothetical protein CEXT_77481 [Caerostris extrusa]|uniref:Uncharacterized protein n=1 Tax=Caerostris extrusa TaxID=172846 RepID=A0AAV4Y7E4_CAEEX|nr:hypothetical protein CEXT_77481 [Caerostris extrusa]